MLAAITGPEATDRLFLVLQNACDWWNYGGQCNAEQEQHLYVKSVELFRMANVTMYALGAQWSALVLAAAADRRRQVPVGGPELACLPQQCLTVGRH
jgi:hypothetical protein